MNSSATSASLLAEIPELYAFLKFRTDSLTQYFAEIRQAVKAEKPMIDIRLNHYAAYPELMGLDLKGIASRWTRCGVRTTANKPVIRSAWNGSGAISTTFVARLGVDKYFLSAISPRPKATPELVKQGILVSAQCGADALTIGHYDGAWRNCLRAIKDGLDEAGIEIRRDAVVCNGGVEREG